MSDFNSITQNGRLCDSKGQLSSAQFEVAMRAQLKYYTHRQLCDCIAYGEASEPEIAQVSQVSIHMCWPDKIFVRKSLQTRLRAFDPDVRSIDFCAGQDP